MKRISIAASFVLCCSVACATVRYVDWKNGVNSTDRDAQSKETAWKSLDFALTNAVDYDEIVMTKGTHNIWQYPVASATGVPSMTIDHPLTIRGEGENWETVFDFADAKVLFAITADNVVLHSLTWYRPKASWNGPLFNLAADAVVSNVVFRGMQGYQIADIRASDGLMTHCWITNNTPWYSALPVLLEDKAHMENCYVANNVSDRTAVIQLNGADVVLRNCTIVNNTAPSANGAAVVASAACGCYNNLIWGNVNSGFVTANWSGAANTDDWLSNCTTPTTGLLGSGNTDGNPCLIENNLDFGPKSSCRGTALSAKAPATDLRGTPRAAQPSIGAVEYVDQGGLELTLTASATFVREPTELTVAVSVDNAYAPPLSYAWDFYGTGATNATTASAVLPKAGMYRPKVTVTDKDGKTGTGQFAEALVVHPAGAATYYIDTKKGNDGNDGLTKASAWKNLSLAIQNAAVLAGDEIVYVKGTHSFAETIVTVDKAITIRGEGENWETVINGTRNGGLNFTADGGRLHSLTMKGFQTSGSTIGLSADVIVSNVALAASNHYNGRQFGISAGLVTHCWSTNSTAWWNMTVAQLTGTGRMENCYIAGSDMQKGSVVEILSADAKLRNCTIVNNKVINDGRAAVYATAEGTVCNNIILGNVLANASTGNWVGASSTTPWRGNCTTPLAGLLGSGNIDADPQFDATEPWKLAKGSPCYGKGVNDEVGGATDILGQPRIVGRRVDIGCYEIPWTPGFLLYLR